MAFYTDTATTAQPRRIAAFFDAIALKLRQNKVYRTTLNELHTLTVRDMNDLGISRADFRRLSREAADQVT